jgi:D-sedoheptulose 7-phosphate isomerase
MKGVATPRSRQAAGPFAAIRHVILDRDGVLNREAPAGKYIANSKDFHWIARSLDALATLRNLGLRISVATNQSGIGRGLMSDQDLQAVHRKMSADAEAASGAIDAIFYCPHLPTDNCTCRKPAGGLIVLAMRQAEIPAAQTLVIGDDLRDLEAALSEGVRAAMVRTGKGSRHEAQASSLGVPIFDDLAALAHSLSESVKAASGVSALPAAVFAEHIAVANEAATTMRTSLLQCMALITEGLLLGHKVIACGNGGSAADAQHFIAEVVGRYKAARAALPGIALPTDPATLTAIANDFGFEHVFARQINALAQRGDILIALSTSGNSPNVINAADAARDRGCTVIAFTGRSGGELAQHADLLLAVPSDSVARIQEMHGLCLHALAEAIDLANLSAEAP